MGMGNACKQSAVTSCNQLVVVALAKRKALTTVKALIYSLFPHLFYDIPFALISTLFKHLVELLLGYFEVMHIGVNVEVELKFVEESLGIPADH
jgi:hypothetical protein